MDIHSWTGTPTEDELALMRERMKLFIFPNEARTADEAEAFEQAVLWQLAHEKSVGDQAAGMPDGVKSFRIGDFQMEFEAGMSSGLTRRTVCPAAYSLLLRKGLLYRGLPRVVSE